MATLLETSMAYKAKLEAERKNSLDEFQQLVELGTSYMAIDGSAPVDKLPLMEALSANDASIIFPKIVSNVLMKPVEGQYIGQTLLAKTIRIDGARSFEIPGIGALVAQDIAGDQAPVEQSLDFRDWRTEIKIGKSGVLAVLPEDTIEDSQWELVGLYLEACQNALNRWKEQKIFTEFEKYSQTIFDNTVNSADFWTAGKGTDGVTNNGSVAFDDFVDGIGAVLANNFNPTDIILNPLAWVVFAKNPILRNLMLTQSTLGQSVWKGVGPESVQANIPWALQVQLTPFQKYERDAVKTLYVSGGTAASVTDDFTTITVIDRNNALLILQREDPMPAQFNDPLRDLLYMKVVERYGLGVINAGRAIASMKNVRVTPDYSPVYNIGTVTMA